MSRAVRSRPSAGAKRVCRPCTRGGRAQNPQNGDIAVLGTVLPPQDTCLMDSQPLTHSHLRLRLLLHLGIPNTSLLSLCGCRVTYSGHIRSCWSRHKRGYQVSKPGTCGHYNHFFYPNAGKGGRPPSLPSCFTSFTLVKFLPHERPRVVGVCPPGWVLPRRCRDCGLHKPYCDASSWCYGSSLCGSLALGGAKPMQRNW